MMSTSIRVVDLSEDNEVTVVTRWDTELRKKGSYKIAVSILSGRKFGAPSLAVMREMLDVIVHQQFQDFFLNNSEQAKSFDDLKKVSATQAIDTTATGWRMNLSTSMPFPQGQRMPPASPHHRPVPLASPRHQLHAWLIRPA